MTSRRPLRRDACGRVPTAVTWGLFAAWPGDDAEELVTMAGWADRARPRLERNLPRVPPEVWQRMNVSQEHASAAIGVMACVIGAAAARGARTGGRSPFFPGGAAGPGRPARAPRGPAPPPPRPTPP